MAELGKVAEKKNLLVKTNRQYLENKKTQDELTDELAKIRKKIDVNGFSNDLLIEKLEKDIVKFHR